MVGNKIKNFVRRAPCLSDETVIFLFESGSGKLWPDIRGEDPELKDFGDLREGIQLPEYLFLESYTKP